MLNFPGDVHSFCFGFKMPSFLEQIWSKKAKLSVYKYNWFLGLFKMKVGTETNSYMLNWMIVCLALNRKCFFDEKKKKKIRVVYFLLCCVTLAKWNGCKKLIWSDIYKISNIFVISYNYKRYLHQFIRLFANIYQCKVVHVSPNSNLCMPHKDRKDAHAQFPNFKFKIILKRKQTFFYINLFLIGHVLNKFI